MTMASDPTLVLLRGTHVAALLSLVGVLAFVATLAPAEPILRQPLRRLALWSTGAGLALGVAWFLVQTATIASAGSIVDTFAAIGPVIADMQFGRLLVLRLALLVAVLGLLAGAETWRRRAALALATVALEVQPWLGHAGAAEGRLGEALVGSELVHLLAAALWLGGLMPLLLCLTRLPAGSAGRVIRGFTWLGLGAVLALALTATFQGAVLAGGVVGLTGTAYGRVALVKTALFAAALVLAALNGLVLAARLPGSDGAAARRDLRWSVTTEAALGLGIVLAAGWLASLAPGVDVTPDRGAPGPLLAGLLLPALAVAAAVWLLHTTRILTPPRSRP